MIKVKTPEKQSCFFQEGLLCWRCFWSSFWQAFPSLLLLYKVFTLQRLYCLCFLSAASASTSHDDERNFHLFYLFSLIRFSREHHLMKSYLKLFYCFCLVLWSLGPPASSLWTYLKNVVTYNKNHHNVVIILQLKILKGGNVLQC